MAQDCCSARVVSGVAPKTRRPTSKAASPFFSMPCTLTHDRSHHKRRWLYEDLDIKKSEAKRDRIYFTRSGEVFYQMLCRSKKRDALNKLLPRLLKTGNPWSQLCGSLEDPTDDTRKRRSGSDLTLRARGRPVTTTNSSPASSYTQSHERSGRTTKVSRAERCRPYFGYGICRTEGKDSILSQCRQSEGDP